jgi:hypothetical protein
MRPAHKDMVYRRGDTPSLSLVLYGYHVQTRAVARLPQGGRVVSWKIKWPSGLVTKTTATDGGLTVDARTGEITWPLQQSDIDGLGEGVIVPFEVAVIEADNRKTTYLTGTISAEGHPL